MKTGEKIQSIDVIRVISMFCIIFLHCASNRLRVSMYTPGWRITNLLTTLADCGVPMFFMISGALILRSENTKSISYTLKKRLPRLIIPLFAWSVISILVNLYMDPELELSAENFHQRIMHFLNEPSAVHLWFMYYLIPIYLISPALKVFTDNAEKKTLRYILILWLLFILSASLNAVFTEENQKMLVTVSFINNIGFISGYLGYFLLGYYIMQNDIKINPVILIVTAVSAALFICAGTEHVSRFSEYYAETFKSYHSILIVILSTAVFLLLKDIKITKAAIMKAVSFLASLSYGIYLSHNCIIEVLNRRGLENYSLRQIFICFIITSLVSVIAMGIISRIKYVSYVFAGIKSKRRAKK